MENLMGNPIKTSIFAAEIIVNFGNILPNFI